MTYKKRNLWAELNRQEYLYKHRYDITLWDCMCNLWDSMGKPMLLVLWWLFVAVVIILAIPGFIDSVLSWYE